MNRVPLADSPDLRDLGGDYPDQNVGHAFWSTLLTLRIYREGKLENPSDVEWTGGPCAAEGGSLADLSGLDVLEVLEEALVRRLPAEVRSCVVVQEGWSVAERGPRGP